MEIRRNLLYSQHIRHTQIFLRCFNSVILRPTNEISFCPSHGITFRHCYSALVSSCQVTTTNVVTQTTYMFVIPQFPWVRNLGTVYLGPLLRVSRDYSQAIGQSWGLIWCLGAPSTFMWLFVDFSSLQLQNPWVLASSRPAGVFVASSLQIHCNGRYTSLYIGPNP